MDRLVLAADLGGTNLRMAAIDEAGTIVSRSRRPTPKSCPADQVVQVMMDAADECRSALTAGSKVVAVAAAVPATVNFEKGVMLKAPNLQCLDGFAMRDVLGELFGVESLLENDANAAAVGEHWLGASKGISNSVMVTLGTGVGGGIIINGGILRGIDGTAAEIGHICVEPLGARCGCGSRGCVEQYASATAVVRMANDLAGDFPESKLTLDQSLTASAVYEAALAGDELAKAVFRQMGRYLGIALADLINILNPEAIVIGGGAAGSWDLFMPHVKAEIKVRAFQEPAERAQILRAALDDDAGLLGVAKLTFDRLA